ncbi:DUF4249 family protein [Persicobacter sp. CCB-QB2]|uniref:DUF4249 family protein n=1 Tax=Persicobacter sp. CCB-QB2 TaxID=1561025 RepID=UPI0006A9F395|nr:DUF4249 family protein [Persicobacter sp. CCB-QB2]
MGKKFVIIILVVFLGCKPVDSWYMIPIEGYAPYFVEAYMEHGSPLEFTLFESQPLKDSLLLKPVWNANALLMDELGNQYELENLFYRRGEDGRVVNYVYVDSIDWEAQAFELQFTLTDGTILASQTRAIKPPDLIAFGNDVSRLWLSFNHQDDDDYYRLVTDYYINGERNYQKSQTYELLKQGEESWTIAFNHPTTIEYDSMVVHYYKYTEDAYRFFESVRKAKVGIVDPTSPAVPILSNIEGGSGIFSYVWHDTIHIRRN